MCARDGAHGGALAAGQGRWPWLGEARRVPGGLPWDLQLGLAVVDVLNGDGTGAAEELRRKLWWAGSLTLRLVFRLVAGIPL